MASTSKTLRALGGIIANNCRSPEWGRLNKQIFGPGQKYHWESSWSFGTI